MYPLTPLGLASNIAVATCCKKAGLRYVKGLDQQLSSSKRASFQFCDAKCEAGRSTIQTICLEVSGKLFSIVRTQQFTFSSQQFLELSLENICSLQIARWFLPRNPRAPKAGTDRYLNKPDLRTELQLAAEPRIHNVGCGHRGGIYLPS